MYNRTRFLLFIIILTTAAIGCNSNKKVEAVSEDPIASVELVTETDTCITVDVNAKYPHKSLMLQDIMDVEYVPLESTDEFLCQGIVQAVGKDHLLVRNAVNDGNIYIFDRSGKGIRTFNRKGQGPGEYIVNLSAFLDDTNAEIYIDNVLQDVLVYDLEGNFKKQIRRSEPRWINPMNFDSDYIIARESPVEHKGKQIDNQRFMLISKQDSRVANDFRIYFTDKIEWGISNRSGSAGKAPRPFPIVPFLDSWLLVEHSSDTIFKLSPDQNLTPFIVRTPSVQDMKPAKFLLPAAFSDQYYFMELLSMEADPSQKNGFLKKSLAYDRMKDEWFEYSIYNKDFISKEPIFFTMQETTNQEIAFCQKLEADKLIEALAKGELSGKLKDIAASLNENSNAVIMLAKYK